ncbi:hypothetical protein [Ruminococcus sp.]|uniref:hypothetical protein n=1 Tax=Ruminococcus sp. TaxID=41978 RepID=UPI001B0BEAD3|nr:hypothetical protein [Ruminococcus sp.]MBO5558260.1 hypothetical protein [Ruminococcus sp.]
MRRKHKSNRQGAVLMTVTIVAVMMVVIVGAAISLVAHTNSKTNEEYRKKQAYFAASSCLEAFVVKETNMIADGTYTNDFIQQKLDELLAIADSGTTATVKIGELNGSGEVDEGNLIGAKHARWNDIKVTLRVERMGEHHDSDTSLRAIAVGKYLGESVKVVAYMSTKPLAMGKTVPGALEIIGTNGGGNLSYNNIKVYGNTSAPLLESHNVNAIYALTTNDSKFYGDTGIYGSLAFSGGSPQMTSNPYYVPGKDNGQTKGCTLYVSRSFTINRNVGNLTSKYEKGRNDPKYDVAPKGENAFNYIQVDEAMCMMAENAFIGEPNFEIDVYAHLLSIGKRPSDITLENPNAGGITLLEAMSKSVPNDADRAKYEDFANDHGSGNNLKINGNVYIRKLDEFFDGSLYLSGLHTEINGDVYVEGDVYVLANDTKINGNLYILPSNNPGETVEDRIHRTGSLSVSGDTKLLANWTGMGGRATVPNNFAPMPYYYYPEHMLCLRGQPGMTVSTICNTYMNFYEADGKTLKPASSDTPHFTTDDNGQADDAATFGSGYDYSYVGGYGSPKTKHFTAVANKSFVLGGNGQKINNAHILVDLDNAEANADGRHDIVIILGNNTNVMNDFEIIVKNQDHDSEGSDPRFCYLVSDAGVGTVNDEYATQAPLRTKESTYSDFIDAPIFDANNRFNLQELDTYLEVERGHGLNPTDKEYNDPNIYDLPHGCIIMLLTEGAKFYAPQDTYMQCTIYGPRATFQWRNNGKTLKIYPAYEDDNNGIMTNIIGSCIVNEYKTSGNNNTIVYNPVSSKSMVAVAHGFGEALADRTFTLDYYDSH